MKRAISLAVCLTLICALSACATESRYNESPDLSKKVVGSSRLMTQDVPLDSVAEIAGMSDLIVVGTVVGDDEVTKFNSSGNDEYAAAAAQKGIDVYLPATIATVEITRVIDGTLTEETVEVFQLGEPGKADMQTKLKNGDRVLLMLSEYADGTYTETTLESSVFYLDGENELLSMSDEMICARYDDRPLSLLLEDLVDAGCVTEEAAAAAVQ